MGDTEVTTYIEYRIPGVFLSETSTHEVVKRDIQAAADYAPRSAFSFRFYDVVVTSVEVAGQVVSTRSDAINESPLYYIDADEYTVEDVKTMEGMDILVSNMLGNDWPVVLRCRTGNWQPKMPGDVLIRTR